MSATALPAPEVPKEVLEAVRTIELWTAKQGFKAWELGGICSRNHALLLHDIMGCVEKWNNNGTRN
jgi:hypothetical protein